MEPRPPPSSTPPPGSTPSSPPASASEPSLAGLPSACPQCGQEREADDRYCPACGYDFADQAGGTARTGGLGKPLLWILVVFWAAVAVAGLIYLYNGFYRL